MKKIIILIILLITASSFAGGYKIRLSGSDKFEVESPSKEWTLKKEKYERGEKAWLSLKPTDHSFLLQMLFKTPPFPPVEEYLRGMTIKAAGKHLQKCVESKADVIPMDLEKGYGFYTVLTDKEIDESDPGDFRYITTGVIGLSDHTELNFMILTHEPDNEIHKTIMKYVAEFIK